MPDITMPPLVARLPRDRGGHPIFATIARPEDNGGEPDFAVLDPERATRRVRDRLCGACRKALDYWIALIGGDPWLGSRLVGFAMRPECARYSLRACPHPPNPRATYRPVPSDKPVRVNRVVDDRRPPRWFLFIARRYEPVVVRGESFIKTAPFARMEPFS